MQEVKEAKYNEPGKQKLIFSAFSGEFLTLLAALQTALEGRHLDTTGAFTWLAGFVRWQVRVSRAQARQVRSDPAENGKIIKIFSTTFVMYFLWIKQNAFICTNDS